MNMLQEFLGICEKIGMPVAPEKTCEPAQRILFLGMELDSVNQIIRIPEDKRFKAMNALDNVISSRKVTVLELQQLAGLLNFLGRAIVPGRAFTRRIYSKYADPQLKQHYHVNVDKELCLDCMMWMKFLSWDKSIYRPFMDFGQNYHAEALQWFTDSSRNKQLGFGCYYQGRYAYGKWNDSEPDFIDKYDPSINFLELYSIVLSVELWCHLLKNRRVTIYSDNLSAVHMVNNSTSVCKRCMKLIRIMTLTCLKNNTRVFVKHLPGKFNILSDSLSRNNLRRFFKFAPTPILRSQPEILPPSVWPLKKEWFL